MARKPPPEMCLLCGEIHKGMCGEEPAPPKTARPPRRVTLPTSSASPGNDAGQGNDPAPGRPSPSAQMKATSKKVTDEFDGATILAINILHSEGLIDAEGNPEIKPYI